MAFIHTPRACVFEFPDKLDGNMKDESVSYQDYWKKVVVYNV